MDGDIPKEDATYKLPPTYPQLTYHIDVAFVSLNMKKAKN